MIKDKLIKAVVLTVVISAILFSSILVFQNELPIFMYVDPDELPPLISNNTADIGQETGQFLWEYREADLITQAFVLFATAVCCVILLRVEEKV